MARSCAPPPAVETIDSLETSEVHAFMKPTARCVADEKGRALFRRRKSGALGAVRIMRCGNAHHVSATVPSARRMRANFAIALWLVLHVSPAIAEGIRSISGDYVCAYGCRPTDAPPSVEIDGNTAICMNELGGVYRGRVLSDNSIACFNKVGTLSADGQTLRWDDGVVWKRRR